MTIRTKTIKLSNGTVKTFVVPHAVDYDDVKYTHEEIAEWCKQNCKAPFNIKYRWQVTFHDDDDAMLFKLRWS